MAMRPLTKLRWTFCYRIVLALDRLRTVCVSGIGLCAHGEAAEPLINSVVMLAGPTVRCYLQPRIDTVSCHGLLALLRYCYDECLLLPVGLL